MGANFICQVLLHSLVPRAKPSRQERGVWHLTGEAGKPIQPLHPSIFMPLGGVPKGLDLCCRRCYLTQALPGSTWHLSAWVTPLELYPSMGRTHTPFALLWATSPQSRGDRACWLALTLVGCSILVCAACRGAPGPLVRRVLAGAG